MSDNPYKTIITSLEDTFSLSPFAQPAVKILREEWQSDSAHDESHLVRVTRNALWFGEEGDKDVIIPAAILHDLVNVPKNSPLRPQASELSAMKAIDRLAHYSGFKNGQQLTGINHAIKAHSYSANITPETIEAKALQDADRLDALGHIGIARMFAAGGSMNRILFHPTDPLGLTRDLDECRYTLDHYFVKLQHLPQSMQTRLGKKIAVKLELSMYTFIEKMIAEM